LPNPAGVPFDFLARILNTVDTCNQKDSMDIGVKYLEPRAVGPFDGMVPFFSAGEYYAVTVFDLVELFQHDTVLWDEVQNENTSFQFDI